MITHDNYQEGIFINLGEMDCIYSVFAEIKRFKSGIKKSRIFF